MTIAISGTNGITLDGQFNSASSMGFKNRLINSAMVIDQRNAGASVTTTNTVAYTIDRFRATAIGTSLGFSSVKSATAPTGFINSYLATVTSAKAVASTDQTRIDQFIEGFNVADLGFGTATASTITLSFWVRSSVTGTYCVHIGNSTSPTRSYIAEYTISSANTFEYKTITIAGDTTGTWTTGNSVGIGVSFVLGMGSSFNGSVGWQAGEEFQTSNQTQWINNAGATFYITGVQLEKGSTATSFDYRPYGTELALCQRYFQKSYDQANALASLTTTGEVRWQAASTGGESAPTIMLPVVMRTAPTLTLYSAATGASGNVRNYSTAADVAMTGANVVGARGWSGGSTGFTAGNIVGYQFAASSEL